MSQSELLSRVVDALDAARVEYMVTGSIASSLQGEPRSSHDIDVVVALGPEALPALAAAFPAPRFYLDDDAAGRAIRARGMFNLIDSTEGDKVDFWLLTDGAFDRSRFARRRAEKALGREVVVSAPEDTILMKLSWAKRAGESERHFTDALGVYEVQAATLDRAYLESWIDPLGIGDLWARLLREAEPI